jgi:hypothetical protein
MMTCPACEAEEVALVFVGERLSGFERHGTDRIPLWLTLSMSHLTT